MYVDTEKASQKQAWYWKADWCGLVLSGNSRNYFFGSLIPNQQVTADPQHYAVIRKRNMKLKGREEEYLGKVGGRRRNREERGYEPAKAARGL